MIELVVDGFGDGDRRALEDAAEVAGEVLFESLPIAAGEEGAPDVTFDEESMAVAFLGCSGDFTSIVRADEVVRLGALRAGVGSLEFSLALRQGSQFHRLSLGDEGREERLMDGGVSRHRIGLEKRMRGRDDEGERPVVEM